MRLFIITDSWAGMHDDMLFTRSILHASRVHAPLAGALDEQVQRWRKIDEDRAGAEALTVAADARVAWVDVTLDACTTRFAAQLLIDCNGNRAHETFVAFFPSAPHEMTRLALERQIEKMSAFPAIAADVKLSTESAAALQRVTANFADAREALQARSDAQTVASGVSRRRDAWVREANTARRGVEQALYAYANANGLPRNYADTFFPSPRRRASKKTEASPAPRPSGAPQPA